MFYLTFIELCAKAGISPSAAAEEMGFQRSVVTRWRGGTVPRDANLQRVADYFNVPVEALTAGQKEKAPGRMAEDLSADELEIVSILRKMSPEQLARELAYLRQASADGQGK